MSLEPVKLPPGVFRNATPYGQMGRWVDASLVRWHNKSLRSIGGWTRRAQEGNEDDIPAIVADPAVETVRDVITYSLNTGERGIVFGSNLGLYATDGAGLINDITPDGLVGGLNNITYLIGYGISVYGARAYGTARNPSDATPLGVPRWQFSMWGENCLAVCSSDGLLYEYVPGADKAIRVVNSPNMLTGGIVTDERIVMVIRDTIDDVREVIWSDREDNTDWTPTDVNYAGSYVLQGSGLLLGIYKVQGQVLILSDTEAYLGTYLGAPYVYGFNSVGTDCTPLSAQAVSKTERFAIWMSDQQFWIFDGNLRPLPCDVMDYIKETLDLNAASKVHSMNISSFNEVWWFYQSKNSSNEDIDTYVVYNFVDSTWNIGRLMRTCGVDKGVLRSPIMVDQEGRIFNHEQQNVKPIGDSYAISGPIDIQAGSMNMAVRYAFLDTQSPNSVELTMYTRQLPTDADTQHGPFPIGNPVSTTGVLGREVRFKVRGLTTGWEFGTMRIDVAPSGGGFR